MDYKKTSIKELKNILEEYNCAIPSGAKKKDLVELVEAIMSKDEDFVTMQIANEEDIFDAPQEETQEETMTLQEDVGKSENRPSMFSDEWNEFVMAHFHNNELMETLFVRV